MKVILEMFYKHSFIKFDPVYSHSMTSRSTCILNQKWHTGTSTYTYRFCSTRNFQNVYLKLSSDHGEDTCMTFKLKYVDLPYCVTW